MRSVSNKTGENIAKAATATTSFFDVIQGDQACHHCVTHKYSVLITIIKQNCAAIKYLMKMGGIISGSAQPPGKP